MIGAVLRLVAQSCPTLCDPMDCSQPGSSVPGILQARILEWVAMLSSRGSSQHRDRTQVSQLQADSLLSELSRKPLSFFLQTPGARKGAHFRGTMYRFWLILLENILLLLFSH